MPSSINLEDFRRRARRRLPRAIFDFVDGGAEDEVTLRSNRRAFEEITFQPRSLVDVSVRDQSTTVLGVPVSMPVLLGPTGLVRLVCREGECGAARAATRMGTVFVLSTAASTSIEEVAAQAHGQLWFQLYLWRDREVVRALVDRAGAAGYKVLCLTVDVPITGQRERDLRNGMTLPPRLTARNVVDAAHRLAWLRGFAHGGRHITFENLAGQVPAARDPVALYQYQNEQLINPAATWDDLVWLRELWPGRIVVKGVTTIEDARRVIDCGADGIVVSNHGGRQLDGLPPSIDVLPEIADAVNGQAEVLLDGGVRRGSDVIKALALGARACLVARPYLFALAAGGEQAVVQMLELLRSEIDRTLALIGRPSLSDLDRSAVRLPQLSSHSVTR